MCVINVDGYFDGLVAQLAAAKHHNLLHMDPTALIGVEPTATKALAHCLRLVKPPPAEPPAVRRSVRVAQRSFEPP